MIPLSLLLARKCFSLNITAISLSLSCELKPYPLDTTVIPLSLLPKKRGSPQYYGDSTIPFLANQELNSLNRIIMTIICHAHKYSNWYYGSSTFNISYLLLYSRTFVYYGDFTIPYFFMQKNLDQLLRLFHYRLINTIKLANIFILIL